MMFIQTRNGVDEHAKTKEQGHKLYIYTSRVEHGAYNVHKRFGWAELSSLNKAVITYINNFFPGRSS